MKRSPRTPLPAILRRDLLLAMRRRGESLTPLLFLLMVVSLFPLGLGPDPKVLATSAAAIVWVAALLSVLLSLERLFRSDFDDGSLEQFALSPCPLPALVLSKVLAHWLVSGLPVVLAGPILAMMLNLPSHVAWTLLHSLALGTPVLSLVGSIGVGLTVGLRRGGILVSLLVLPLYVPILIFGAGAVHAAGAGFSPDAHLLMLGALLALALTLAPIGTAAALRISLT